MGSGTYEKLVPALPPVKTEETVSHLQNNSVKEVGTPPVPSGSCTSLTAVSTAAQSNIVIIIITAIALVQRCIP